MFSIQTIVSILTYWGRDKIAADDIFKCIVVNENTLILLTISSKFAHILNTLRPTQNGRQPFKYKVMNIFH